MSDYSAGDYTVDGTHYGTGTSGGDSYSASDFTPYATDGLDAIIKALKSGSGGAAALGGLLGLLGANSASSQKVGYLGGIPKYAATRTPIAGAIDLNRTPGSAGQKYFTDVDYTLLGPLETPTDVSKATPANTPGAANVAAALAALQAAKQTTAQQPATDTLVDNTAPGMQPSGAHGGLAALKKGRYLIGDSDGMADKVPANIDGKQQARLSHGEFVIPADVVSHLGNGNSDAGAQRLYDMMDKIRKARTGTKKQGKQINPDKFMPR